MKKWKHFPSIVARQRTAREPDRYLSEFQEVLQSWLSIHNYKISAYFWAIAYAQRNLPRVAVIVLLHRRTSAAAIANITAAIEQAFEDIANITVVVTVDRKAFRGMVAQRIF
jgi:hypothetical protein